jgi:hypothetical protein
MPNENGCSLTLTEVRCYGVDLDIGAYETRASLLEAIDAAEPWTQVAIAEVLICQSALLSSISGGEQLISRNVVVKEKGWGHVGAVSPTSSDDGGMCTAL